MLLKPKRVAVAGDWHGNTQFACGRLMSLGEAGTDVVLHAGDLGVWPGASGKRYLLSVEKVCARYGIQLLCTPGNHEDWRRLDDLWFNPKNRDGRRLLPLRLTDHITVLPRGHRFTLESPQGRVVTFVSLGGAPSIDYEFRTANRDWWRSETITDEDVQTVLAGGYADVMLTHDSPGKPYATPGVAAIMGNPDSRWSAAAREYALGGTQQLTKAFLGVAPRLLVHGHFHAPGETRFRLPDVENETRVWSLGCDGQPGNVRLLDLDEDV